MHARHLPCFYFIAPFAVGLALSAGLLGCASGAVTARVVHPPAPMDSGGKRHLTWEIAVRNTTEHPVRLVSVTAEIEGNRPVVVEGKQLARQMALVGVKAPKKNGPGHIGPGQTALVYLWHSFSHKDRLPNGIVHRVEVVPLKGDTAPRVMSVHGPVLDINPTVVETPLAGQGWFSANAPFNGSRHRRHAKRIEEKLHMAQRFAVDFVRILGASGTRKAGSDAKRNESYNAYGAPIYAVAKGIVLKVVDGIPENTPGKHRAVPMSEETLAGNLVVLDIGDDLYVTFAHLIPGSVTVKVGDIVRVGQILGKVGNSGNSTEPHLHLHVCDAPSVLRCQGVPIAFRAFTEIPITMVPGRPPRAGSERRVEAELPVNNGFLSLPPKP